MGKSLVIVESPTKARTIANFLPKDFVVESSLGHVRDLPSSAKEIPEKLKDEPWARLGINIKEGFEPIYVIPPEKKKVVQKLKGLLKNASTVYLATDEDREGESISWHLVEVLQPRIPRKRLVFHEITREAIEEALRSPRDIDLQLVEAQETRRILDRLYGYEVSPVLWRKIAPKLSAGRVQSVAVKVIVDRERERRSFVRSTYWDLVARFAARDGGAFEAVLISLEGRRIASGDDFDPATGRLREATNGRAVILVDQDAAEDLLRRLGSSVWKASKVEQKPDTERPAPPFTTSTLQQEANRKLRFTARQTMVAAQRLYESGLITYMRTDSTTLSEQALGQTRNLIENLYGQSFLSPEPRRFQTRVKNAQEAHEAIRPAGDFRLPEDVRGEVGAEELRLYELIWKRTIACQMADARVQNTTLQVSDGYATFQTNGRTIEFPGFLRAYVEGADDPDAKLADMERALPSISVGQELECETLEAKSHTTQPPRRYTEASLIKELESNGVGRPSTYASIIDTILRREYVVKQGTSLVPTFVAFAVVSLLEKNFAELVDIQFTAHMEDDLDDISLGEKKSLPYLKSFYYGNGGKTGLRKLVQSEIDPRESCTIPLGRAADGSQINVRIGRYGPYVERGEDRAPIPAGLAPDELTVEKAQEILSRNTGPKDLGRDPVTGKTVFLKIGRFGPYVQLGENGGKPKLKSLLPGMNPEELTLQDGLKLLSLPRSLGKDPQSGEEILADYGRFGPYVKRGADSRSLPKTEDIFQVTIERAVEIFRQEKASGWRSRGPTVIRELGIHPESKAPIKLLDGRYGPYVSDGTTNASLPKGSDLQSVTLDEAVALIVARAQAGPRRGRRTRRASSSGEPSAAPRVTVKAKKRGTKRATSRTR